MRNKVLYLSMLVTATLLMFGCGEPLMDDELDTSTPVVECYLQEGSNSMTVKVYSMEVFLKDGFDLSKPISNLKVNLNNTELTETSSGTYTLDLGNSSINAGETYNLQFDNNGKSIEAATTIPSPVSSLKAEPETIEISSSYYWNFSDSTQVVVTWDDPDNSFYQVYIESPDNPDIPDMGIFRQWIVQPFQGNSYEISSREFRSTGTYWIYVYRVNNDYVEIFERMSASDLANPVSYIENAFGIFTSMSVEKVRVRAYESSE